MQKVLLSEHARTEVNRLHHASRRHNPKQRVEIRLIRDISSIQRDREGLGTVHLKLNSLQKMCENVSAACVTALLHARCYVTNLKERNQNAQMLEKHGVLYEDVSSQSRNETAAHLRTCSFYQYIIVCRRW